MAYYFNRHIPPWKPSFSEMPIMRLIGGNGRPPTDLDAFLPQNIPSHNLCSVAAVGEAISHKKPQKLRKKRMNNFSIVKLMI